MKMRFSMIIAMLASGAVLAATPAPSTQSSTLPSSTHSANSKSDSNQTQARPAQPGMNIIVGTIASIDQSARKIVIKGRKSKNQSTLDTISYNDATRVSTAAKTMSISDLGNGTRVIVIFNVNGGQKVALKIAERMPKNAGKSNVAGSNKTK